MGCRPWIGRKSWLAWSKSSLHQLPMLCYGCAQHVFLTTRLLSSTSILFPRTTCSIISHRVQIKSSRSRHTYKGKVGGIPRRGLDQELVSPAVQRLEALGVVDVVHQNAAVGSSVECDAQRLESLLSGSVPELSGSLAFLDPMTLVYPQTPHTCMVTCRSSTRTSRVKKSAPIVAL